MKTFKCFLFEQKYREDEHGNLVDDKGNFIVPKVEPKSEYIYHRMRKKEDVEKIRKAGGLKNIDSKHKETYFWHGPDAEQIASVYHNVVSDMEEDSPILRVHRKNYPYDLKFLPHVYQ